MGVTAPVCGSMRYNVPRSFVASIPRPNSCPFCGRKSIATRTSPTVSAPTATVAKVPGVAVLDRTSCVPSADKAIVGTPPKSFWMASPLYGTVPSAMGPRSVATPVLSSMPYSRVPVVAVVREANDRPTASGLAAVIATLEGMSKPFTAVKSSGAPLRVTVSTSVAVPLFGGACSNSVLVVASRWYRLVSVAFGKELVYPAASAPTGPPTPPLIAVSGWTPSVASPPKSISAPVFGFIRKLNPVSVVTRMRSTTGLKSNPKAVPVIGTGVLTVATILSN